MITAARWTLRILNWLNWGLGIPIVVIGTAIGWLATDYVVSALADDGIGAPHAVVQYLRFATPMMAPIIWLAHLIFSRLIAMIDTIPSGLVFSLANADRLRTVAWALLGTQILDLIAGIHTQMLSENTGEYFGWSFGLTGWLAALLLFILARIFREGATMREELEGTV